MNELRKILLTEYQGQRGLSVLASQVIVVLSIACLGYGYAHFLDRVLVHAGFLTLVCPLIAWEALLTQRRVAEMEGREKWVFRLAEILTILILLKAFVLLRGGLLSAWVEIQGWQVDFLTFLESPEYLASLIILIPVWSASTLLSSDIDTLHDRDDDSSWDELGKVQNALQPVRGRIASTMFALGAIVIFCAIGARLNFREYVPFLQGKFNPDVPLANVLIFFVLVLVLLSQSQLALLRTRWLWDKIHVSPTLTRRWIFYGLVFFGTLAAIVFFLPTNYSLGFFDTVFYTFNLVFAILRILLSILLLPLSICASLFRTAAKNGGTPQPAQIPQIPQPEPNPAAPPFWQFIQSLLFWVLFAGVVIFAITQYIRSNRAFLDRLSHFPLARWILKFVRSIWGWIWLTAREAASLAASSIRRLAPSAAQRQVARIAHNPGGLTAREQIIELYLALLDTGRDAGISRKEGETPYQYSKTLIAANPDISPEVLDLTSDFVEARYSQHDVPAEKVTLLRSAWRRIVQYLRGESRQQ